MKEGIAVSPLSCCGYDRQCKDWKDICSVPDSSSRVDESPKPFAAFGSFRQRNSGASVGFDNGDTPTRRRVASWEAPAMLGTIHPAAEPVKAGSPSEPIDIKILKEARVAKRLQKKSLSTDMDRDEAWERKRDLFLDDELDRLEDEEMPRNLGRTVSDHGGRTWLAPPLNDRSKARARSLTDEDLEELRGCIDLGFSFNYEESCRLRNTLPALDLYRAINRQYKDLKVRSSPVSPLDGTLLQRSCSVDSAGNSFSDAWRISSPGDHPSQVKTRLRHWAQAVACSIRESSFECEKC